MKKRSPLATLAVITSLLGGVAPPVTGGGPVTPEVSPAKDSGNMRTDAAPARTPAQQMQATTHRGASAVSSTGWIYFNRVNSVRVDVLAEVGNCWRVRFTTRKLGLRGRVGAVPKSAVVFTPPHLTARA